jgi:shikimate kinase
MGFEYVLLGNMASGKTSIAMILKNDLDYSVISARDVILARLASAPIAVQELRNQGFLPPDELIQRWIFESIERAKNKNRPLVLDGYPRTPNQARELLARMQPDYFSIKASQFMETTRKIIPLLHAQSIKFRHIQNHRSFQGLRGAVLALVQKGRQNGN